MSHRERKKQERERKEAKIEEAIKNGSIRRVVYEDKKEEASLTKSFKLFSDTGGRNGR